MATRLGSNSKPTYATRWQGYAYDCLYGIDLTLPSGGPWRILTLGAWLAGDATHFGSTTTYLMVWNGTSLIGQSSGFTPTNRTYPGGDSYEKDCSSPPIVAGGTTVRVGFGFGYASGKGLQWPVSNANQYTSTNHTVPGSFTGAYADAGKLQAWLYYEAANQAPTAPTPISLDAASSGGFILLGSGSHTLAFTGHDPDAGDTMASYDWQLDNTSGNGVEPDWAALVGSATGATAGISGQNVSISVSLTLTRGNWYALRCRTTDAGGLTGPWSATYFVKVAQLPTVSLTEPSAAGRLGRCDYAPAAGWASPRLHPAWSFACPDGGTQASYVLEVANDSGGSPGSYLYQSGTVSGQAGDQVVPATITEASYYHVHVRVVCSHGETSAWAGYYRTRTRWGLATFQDDLTVAPSAWSIANLNTTTGGSSAVAIEYTSSADGTTLPDPWQADPASVALRRYFRYRVFLLAWGSSPATTPSLDRLTLNYTASLLAPDAWTRNDATNSYATTETFVYGTQSLRMSGKGSAYKTYQVIPVLPNTNYILSARVKSSGNSGAQVVVWTLGWLPLAQTSPLYGTADWAGYASAVFYSGANTAVYVGATVNGLAGTTGWFDALKLEASTVVTPWQPGYVAGGVTLDAGGIQVDAIAGGVARFRGSAGGARDAVDLYQHGWRFGGDTELSSPSLGNLGVAGEAPGGFVPAGAIVAYGGAAPPAGWLRCDGTSYLRATYPDLFTAIGTTYGSVDGTHFTVPDLRQRFPLGLAASGTGSTLGGTGGTIDHPHASAAHSHSHNHQTTFDSSGTATSWRARQWGYGSSTTMTRYVNTTSASSAMSYEYTDTDATSTTPGSTGTANPPFQVVAYIIKT